MSNILNAAAAVSAPHDIGRTANDFGVRRYTAETTFRADTVPDTWRGKWVELYVTGGTAGTDSVHYAFSLSSAAEVSTAVAATNAGATDKVGAVIPTGETRHVLIPVGGDPAAGTGDIYFVRDSTAASMSVYMRLASP
jgi:hypothetical protein